MTLSILTLSLLTLHIDTQHINTQHNDSQHNDTQYIDTRHNDTKQKNTQHKDTQHDTQLNLGKADCYLSVVCVSACVVVCMDMYGCTPVYMVVNECARVCVCQINHIC